MNKPPDLELQTIVDFFNDLAIKAPPQPLAPPATQTKRHKLLHVDFWFILMALGANLAMTSSFTIPGLNFETLVFIAIACLIVAMISNLIRDSETMHVYKFELRTRPVKPALVAKPGGFWTKFQLAAGIKPRES